MNKKLIAALIVVVLVGCEKRPTPFAARRVLASDGSQANVQSIHDTQATDGDVITVPSGTFTWTGTLQITKAITLQGAGAVSSVSGGGSTTGSDVTSLVDAHPNNEHKLIGFNVLAGKTARLTGFNLVSDANTKTTQAGLVQVGGGANCIRLDHLHFQYKVSQSGAPSSIAVYGGVTGVIDHVYFDQPPGNGPVAVYLQNGVMPGDAEYAAPDDWGTDKFIFIEDCRWNNGYLGDANTGGQRFVFRHNGGQFDVNGALGYCANHGITPGRGRSSRAMEYYQNTFTTSAPGLNKSPFPINGGTAILWGNVLTQYRYGLTIDYTRKDNGTYPYGSTPTTWGNCTGTSGQVWDGPGGYPCLDQPGRGKGDLLSGSFPNVINTRTGNPSQVMQDVSPIYIFNTTFNPATGYSPVALVANLAPAIVKVNREYYQQFGPNGESGTFDGTRGVGEGPVANRTTTCTKGVGWWDPATQTLSVCGPSNNQWVENYYHPYVYPHPLAAGGGTSPSPAPSQSPTPVPTSAPTATILPTVTPQSTPTATANVPSPTPAPTPVSPTPAPSPTPGPSATPNPTSAPMFTCWGYGERDKGSRYAYISWSGSTSTGFDVYRNGKKIATVIGHEDYTDSLGKGGNETFTYKVCETASQVCTNESSVNF